LFLSFFSGEYEPFSNLIYRYLIINQNSNNFSILDYINLLFCLIPNSLFTLWVHFENKIPNLLIQNYCLLNLFGLYINGNIELLIIGALNIVVMSSLIVADSETYYQFNYWFDAFGIIPQY
jgi:hypothetical protein